VVLPTGASTPAGYITGFVLGSASGARGREGYCVNLPPAAL
jgi:hypothetical protein